MPKGRTLSERQRRFIAEYLIHLNATKAAIRAGYSPRSAADIGYDLLRRHKGVMAALAAEREERERRTQVTADRVVTELARIAFADIRNFADWGPDGIEWRAGCDISDDDAAAIAGISIPVKGKGRLKLYDKRPMLELLARHLGLIGPRRMSPPPRTPHDGLPAREILRRKLAQMAGERGEAAEKEQT